jgi:hypothetical protein
MKPRTRVDEAPVKLRGGMTKKAARLHQGAGHWHVHIRSTVIICRACAARIPKYLNPKFCPECGSGRET